MENKQMNTGVLTAEDLQFEELEERIAPAVANGLSNFCSCSCCCVV